jgi:hypothetical protein
VADNPPFRLARISTQKQELPTLPSETTTDPAIQTIHFTAAATSVRYIPSLKRDGAMDQRPPHAGAQRVTMKRIAIVGTQMVLAGAALAMGCANLFGAV